LSLFSKQKYAINLLNARSIWTPEPYQMLRWPNPSRLNSLWLGIVAPLIMLPGRLWNECIRVIFAGHLKVGLAMLGFIVSSSLEWLSWGLNGHAIAINLTPDVLAVSRFMDVDEAVADLMTGNEKLLIRVE
jgi:hypothetical protein